jgi:hypothetical protein
MSKVRSAAKVTAPKLSVAKMQVGAAPPSEVQITLPAPNPSNPPTVSRTFPAEGSVQPAGTKVSGYVYNLAQSTKDGQFSVTPAGSIWDVTITLDPNFPAGLAKLKAYIDDSTVEPASDIILITIGP